jgi:enoyl-CoA hydratase/carnithine racemase
LSKQGDVAAIVLRGSEGAFCSGIDLKVLQAKPGDPDYHGDWDAEAVREMHYALYRSNKPIIGSLERYAINAGAAMVFACDLVVAGESSFLQIGEIQQGADIPMNAGWLRVKSNEAVLARLALLGDRVSALELQQLQLVTKIVLDDEVLAATRVLAERLSGFPQGASQVIKERLRSTRPEDPDLVFPKSSNNALLNAAQVRS